MKVEELEDSPMAFSEDRAMNQNQSPHRNVQRVMRHILIRAAVVASLAISGSVLAAEQAKRREPVVGGACEGCDAVFEGMPAKLDWFSRIAPEGQPGKPLRVLGVVRDQKNWPVPGIIVYAYQTDATGLYPKGKTPHGALRGWAKTNEQGEYGFDTIRPGGYPDSAIPQHIHMHVIEPGRVTYFIDDIVFSDDRRLTPENQKRYVTGRGGDGLVTPAVESKILTVTRDIFLGRNVPGYPSR
jgi:protocatechuate 3,4-dioxygenase beta subunit